MSKILTFRGKREPSMDSRFLQDCGETLDFGSDGNGRFEFNEPVLKYTDHCTTELGNDWKNQELADLFRVKRLLNAAGVVCDIDRGLTDEGDPWCVFCDGDGEVFIHFCRVDGFYLLDSPSIQQPLRGADFNALVSDFTNRAVPRTPTDTSQESERRVLHFHRSGNVRLHPSALLSALIWTLFLASEELVLVTDAKEPDPSQSDTSGADDSFETAPHIDQAKLTVDVSHVDDQSVAPQDGLQKSAAQVLEKYLLDTATKPVEAPLKDVQGAGISGNAYAIGLSTIAVAVGLMSERIWQDDREKVLALLEETDFETLLSNGPVPEPSSQESLATVESFLDKLFGTILSDNLTHDLAILRDSVKEALKTAENTSLDASVLADTASSLFDFQEIVSGDALVFSAGQDNFLKPSDMPSELVSLGEDENNMAGDAETEGGNAPNTSVSQLVDLVLDNDASEALANIFSTWKPKLYEASFNNTQVYASFDLATDKGDTAAQLIEFVSTISTPAEGPEVSIDVDEPGAFETAGKLQTFDDKAQAFMDVLMSRADSVDMLYHDGDLILIDMNAFKTEGARTYTMSWEFGDGSVVSTVGLRADFEAFDLIT